MRKFLALAALVLGLASCQTEPEGLNVTVGSEQLVTVNVAVPEAETRGVAGENSALGALANGVLAEDNVTMRYILQVYYKTEENGQPKYDQSNERLVEYSDGNKVAFEVRLVPDRDYQFVVWADVVTNGEQDVDNHYVTKDAEGNSTLDNITLNGPWEAMDESRDAFTATELIEDYNGSKAIDITLTRPFAKLRVVTTDIKNLTNLGIVPTKAVATYTSEHSVAFNALEGEAAPASESVTHTFDIAKYNNESNTGAEYTLFTDYFFVDSDVVKFNLDVLDANNQSIKVNAFTTDIYVKRNYLTTIKGSILTDNNSFDVTIEDGFAGESGKDDGKTFAKVDTTEELLDAINKGVENITLEGDIDLNDLLSAGTLSTRAGEKFGLTIAADKKFSIDLNGFTLSGESATAGDAMITNNGELNIVNGTVTYKYSGEADSTYGKGNYTIVNYGKLTVNANINIIAGNEGEKFRHALYVIQNAGELVVDGGKILNNTNIAIRNWVGSETKPSNITLNDGEIEGLRGIWNQLPNNNTNLAPKANIVINGGTLTGTAIDGTQDSENILAIYSYTYGNQAKNVCIEVNGGTINGDIALTGGSNKNFVEKVTINGGKFNGLWGDVYSYADDALAKDAITIKGGEFSSIAPLVYLNGAEEGFKLLKDIELTDETYTFTGVGTLDLNGKTLSVINSISDKNNDGTLTSADNVVFIDVRGNLTVKNGTMTLKHTGDNYGWNACTELFYVGFNGTLNVEDTTIENLGGSDMAYCIDMVNAINTTVNVNNSTLKSTYIPFRVFNNGSGMNNVTIKNSTLEGVSRAFWVHIYSNVDNGGKGVKDYTLNLDIYGNGNTFIASNPNRIIEFGFDDEINFNAEGEQIVRINTAEDLRDAINNGAANIILEGDNAIIVDEPVSIPEGVTTTLDLNGKTITGGKQTDPTKSIYAIEIRGTLTLKNGTINSRGVGNYGTLIIEDGVYNAIDTNGGSAIWNYTGSNVTINGGTFTGAQADAAPAASTMYVASGATAVVNGGTFENDADLTYAIISSGDLTVNDATVIGEHGAIANEAGTLTINGGYYEVTGSSTDHVIYAPNGGVTINNGTFNLSQTNASSIGSTIIDGAAVVNGGTFDSVDGAFAYDGQDGLVVYGGTFKNKAITVYGGDFAQFVADGYSVVDNGDDTYTVLAGATKVN